MRPVPGCLSAHSRPPRHCLAIRPRNCGPDLLYLHLRLFLHLHLWPCFQPLVGLSVWLVWPGCLDLDALAAGRLVRLGCWVVSFIEPLLHQCLPVLWLMSSSSSPDPSASYPPAPPAQDTQPISGLLSSSPQVFLGIWNLRAIGCPSDDTSLVPPRV